MLTGRAPFLGKTGFTIMRQHCEDAPQPITRFRPDCPASVEASVLKLLSKKPADRYLATRELVREIRDWPLPDPDRRRDRTSATGPEARAAKTALASFDRCLGADPLLLLHFYQRLKLDPSLAPHLERMNFDRQIEMLRRGVRSLLAYGLGDEDARRELERIAIGHRSYGLAERQLRSFVNVLVAMALERDPHATEASEGEVLRREWQSTMELGVGRFIELAGIERS
jgi:hypothetical protein